MAACILAGYMESRKLGGRVRELEAFYSFLCLTREEIRYSGMPVERIIEKHGKNQRFLVLCAEYCRKGESFPRAWEHGMDDGLLTTGMNRQDLEYIWDFGLGFGASDTEGQLAHCQLYLGFISSALTHAREERDKKAKLYFMLGLFGGIAAALLLS